jgi:hypothetical protein
MMARKDERKRQYGKLAPCRMTRTDQQNQAESCNLPESTAAANNRLGSGLLGPGVLGDTE